MKLWQKEATATHEAVEQFTVGLAARAFRHFRLISTYQNVVRSRFVGFQRTRYFSG
jgi:hypothetical protein